MRIDRIALLTLFPLALAAQSRTVFVVVRAAEANVALPNAEVIERESGVRRFTNEVGQVRFQAPPDRALSLRVRQIGFAFVDVNVAARNSGEDTVAVQLARVAFALPRVRLVARRDCPTLEGSVDDLAYFALDAIREGAERYNGFRNEYPFRVEARRVSELKLVGDRPRRPTLQKEAVNSEDWGESYRPGGVVSFRGLGFSILNLFLQHLADPKFWDVHCVTSAQVEGPTGARVVRLGYEPSSKLTTSDWGGDVVIDSASSVLRRIEFRLRVGAKDKVAPVRLEGYTTFRYPSPFIAIPDSTVSMWWRTAPAAGAEWGNPDVAQALSVERITYRKKAPPRPGADPQGE